MARQRATAAAARKSVGRVTLVADATKDVFFFRKDPLVPWKLVNMGEMSWKSNNFQINRECLLWVNWWNLVEGSDLWSNLSPYVMSFFGESTRWNEVLAPHSFTKEWYLGEVMNVERPQNGNALLKTCRWGYWVEVDCLVDKNALDKLRNWCLFMTRLLRNWNWAKLARCCVKSMVFFPQDTNIPPDRCPRQYI